MPGISTTQGLVQSSVGSVFHADGSWTIPDGVSKISVTLMGGGGAVSGNVLLRREFAVTPGQVATFVVGDPYYGNATQQAKAPWSTFTYGGVTVNSSIHGVQPICPALAGKDSILPPYGQQATAAGTLGTRGAVVIEI